MSPLSYQSELTMISETKQTHSYRAGDPRRHLLQPWLHLHLTKLIKGHDSKTSYFSQTTTTLHIECCRSSVIRVMTSDQLCQVPSILHKKFLSLQQKCHPQCMFIWSLKGFYSNMFPSGGDLSSLKWGQNEVVKTASEDFENVTIEFYGSNIVYFDIICMIWTYLLISPQIWVVGSETNFAV